MSEPGPPSGGRSRLGDRPTLVTGEPVLQRWFVLTLLVLVPVGLGITLWAVLSIPRDLLSAAERRPPGDATVTVDRGDAQLGPTTDTEPGPGCAAGIELIGDSGTRAASRRALEVLCDLVREDRYPRAREGLRTWLRSDGQLRIAIFELSGVEGSARLEDERLVVELNAKFQFDDAAKATPELVHQLALIAQDDWPGAPITAASALAAAEEQRTACERLVVEGPLARGCTDVGELLEDPDPLGLLVDAGYPG